MNKNPILKGFWADPYIFFDSKTATYYLYPTQDSPNWMSENFYVFTSKDLINWSEKQLLLSLTDITWASTKAWAPCMARYNGRYYFSFTAEQSIGIAVSDSPLGPFTDMLNQPLIAAWSYDCQVIDPDIFIDDDGQPYIVFGQGKGYIVKISLGLDECHLLGEPICFTNNLYREKNLDPDVFEQGIYCEGAHLQKINGRYFMSYSCYDTRDPRYCVKYAWSDNVTGPYHASNDNILITATDDVCGTGHSSIIKKDEKYYLFYHRMSQSRSGYERETCFDEINFDDADHPFVIPTR